MILSYFSKTKTITLLRNRVITNHLLINNNLKNDMKTCNSLDWLLRYLIAHKLYR